MLMVSPDSNRNPKTDKQDSDSTITALHRCSSYSLNDKPLIYINQGSLLSQWNIVPS